VLHKTQKEIAVLFNLTQGAISHRIQTAYKRIRYILDHPPIPSDMHEYLSETVGVLYADVCMLYTRTMTQASIYDEIALRYPGRWKAFPWTRGRGGVVNLVIKRVIEKMGKMCDCGNRQAVVVKAVLEYVRPSALCHNATWDTRKGVYKTGGATG